MSAPHAGGPGLELNYFLLGKAKKPGVFGGESVHPSSLCMCV